VSSPTLVVWGKDDKLISSAYAEEFGRQIAGSRVEVLDKCGHIPQLEQPEKTLALVTDFFGTGPATKGAAS
jgi:pimeloyl-ACP methyl ester carboxylesterase